MRSFVLSLETTDSEGHRERHSYGGATGNGGSAAELDLLLGVRLAQALVAAGVARPLVVLAHAVGYAFGEVGDRRDALDNALARAARDYAQAARGRGEDT